MNQATTPQTSFLCCIISGHLLRPVPYMFQQMINSFWCHLCEVETSPCESSVQELVFWGIFIICALKIWICPEPRPVSVFRIQVPQIVSRHLTLTSFSDILFITLVNMDFACLVFSEMVVSVSCLVVSYQCIYSLTGASFSVLCSRCFVLKQFLYLVFFSPFQSVIKILVQFFHQKWDLLYVTYAHCTIFAVCFRHAQLQMHYSHGWFLIKNLYPVRSDI